MEKKYIKLYDLPRGTKFQVMQEGCSIMVTTLEGRRAAGIIQHSKRRDLKVGEIIEWDHQAYLGSDTGPGTPWFKIPGEGRGAFWPNDWGNIKMGVLKQVQ